jgi:hypothetical protein
VPALLAALAGAAAKPGGRQRMVDAVMQQSGALDPAMAAFNQLFDKVLAIPGVAAVLKPSIDALKTKLASLAA